MLTGGVVREVVDLVPSEWLRDELVFADISAVRAAYARFLSSRLEGPRGWVRALEDVCG
jgi:hypothetical protein